MSFIAYPLELKENQYRHLLWKILSSVFCGANPVLRSALQGKWNSIGNLAWIQSITDILLGFQPCHNLMKLLWSLGMHTLMTERTVSDAP